MEESRLKKLFNLDSKKSITGTENETGTGLDPVFAKDYVEKQGGLLMVKSQLTKASEFSFTEHTELKYFTNSK